MSLHKTQILEISYLYTIIFIKTLAVWIPHESSDSGYKVIHIVSKMGGLILKLATFYFSQYF